MKMKKKKLFLSLLCAMLLTMLFSATALAASTVATIGGKSYTTLDAAIKKVKSGQIIVLKKNVTYTKPLTINRSGKSFTINLNKKTITFANKNAYLNVKKGTVKLSNGTIKQKATDGYVIKVQKGAALSIANGTYTGMIENKGKTTITKGTFTNPYKKRDIYTGFISNYGTMAINGGTFDGKQRNTLYNEGTLTVKGGTFKYTPDFYGYDKVGSPEVENGALLTNANKGKVTVSGGKFLSNTLCLWNDDNSTLNVTGGTFTSQLGGCFLSKGKTTISGGTWSVKEDWGNGYIYGGTLTVKDGTFKSEWSTFETYVDTVTIKISGGTFKSTAGTDSPAMLISFNGKIQVTGGTFTGKNIWGYWCDENGDGKITVKGGTFNVKELKKEGELL